MATVIAGPMSCAVLGDMGAEVLKVEGPGGDSIRARAGEHGTSGGPLFEQCNRGKRGLVLDLKKPGGLDAFRGLLKTTDVFVTNIRRKALEALGIDYEQIKHDYPRLVYAHLTGWGRSHTPNTSHVDAENEPAFDIGSFFARSGMQEAFRQGLEAPSPVQWPGGIGDMVTALTVAQGVTTALFQRERTGAGQLVEVSLLHTGMFAMGQQLVSASIGVDNGAAIGWIPTRKSYESRDGVWFQMLGSVPAPAHLPKLLRALDLTQFLPVPKKMWFPPNPGAAELVGAVRGRFRELDSAELSARFHRGDVWHTIVNSPPMVLGDRRARDTNAFFRPEELGGPEEFRLVRSPANLSSSPFRIPARAPHLGEHTSEVLREALAWDDAQIEVATGGVDGAEPRRKRP